MCVCEAFQTQSYKKSIHEIKLKSEVTLVNLWNVRFANLSVLNIVHSEHIEHFKCSSITCHLVPV